MHKIATVDWAAIERRIGGTRIRSVRRLGEGWASRSYLVNDEWVFKLPKSDRDWSDLTREIAFLEWAAGQLPAAVPRFELTVGPFPAARHGFATYRYLPGEPLEVRALSGPNKTRVADQLAGFLRAMHALAPPADVASQLPHEDARAAAIDYREGFERELAARLSEDARGRIVERLERYIDTAGNFDFTPVVLHADLSREHVLANNGDVSAVIDFGDVNWGDPDYDFSYLFTDFGEHFALEVARRYGHQDPDRLAMKLRYFSLVDQIDTLLADPLRPLPGQRDAAWRRLSTYANDRPH